MAERDWKGGRSPAQNRRFTRTLPAIQRERERLEDWYDRNPEDFYNRIFADLPPEERAYMERVMAGLNPERRFDAPGGLMSLIGYGTGDNRATISEYHAVGKPKQENFLVPSTRGYYPRRSGKSKELDAPPLDSPKLTWAEGSQQPQPGAGIAVFSPVEDNKLAEDYRTGRSEAQSSTTDIYDTPVAFSVPTTVWHELFHRGSDSPMFDGPIGESRIEPRFYADDHETIASLMPEYANLDGTAELPFDPERRRKYYYEVVDALNRFLTPENEAKYKVTRYHDPSERSIMERVIEDLLRKE